MVSRKVILSIVVLLIIVVAGVGVYVYYPKPGPAGPSGPTVADTLTIGTTDRITQLDPAKGYDFYTWEVFHNVMGGLMEYEPGTAKLTYNLADSYRIENDGTVYIFNLRPGLKFADGSPLNSSAIKYEIDRVFTTQGDPSWLVTTFVNKTEIVNGTAIKFTLNRPAAFFPSLTATPPYFPVNPKGYPPDQIAGESQTGGAGPYQIKSWVRDQELDLVANPYYWGTPPVTKNIIVRFYRDASALRLGIENGEIDIAWRALNPVDLDSLRKESNLKVYEVPSSYIGFLVFNTKDPPFNDTRLRTALAASIDREEIKQKAFFGTVEKLYTLVPSFLWGRDEVFKQLGDMNLQLATSLLRQAGYSEQHKLDVELWYTTTQMGEPGRDMALVIKENWEKTGLITVTLSTAEWATYLDNAMKGVMKVYIQTWYPDYLDPDDYISPFLLTGGNSWSGNFYSNATVDKMIDLAVTKIDQGDRTSIYNAIQEQLLRDVPVVPVFEGKTIMVTTTKVQGVTLDATSIFQYKTLYIPVTTT
jgi:peptide/nickel transport system substrate-binding protein